jgi:hypothetical protein
MTTKTRSVQWLRLWCCSSFLSSTPKQLQQQWRRQRGRQYLRELAVHVEFTSRTRICLVRACGVVRRVMQACACRRSAQDVNPFICTSISVSLGFISMSISL